MNTETVQERTKDQITRKSRTTIVLALISSVVFAVVMAVVAVVFVSRMGVGSDHVTPEASETSAPLSQSDVATWRHDLFDATRVVVASNSVLVTHGTTVELLAGHTGETLGTVTDAGESVTASATGDQLIAFDDDTIWVWNTTLRQWVSGELPEGTHVRVLGDKAFAISDDRTHISIITDEATLSDVGAPMSGAVPLAAVENNIVWATGDNKIIVATSPGDVIHENTLEAPGGSTVIERRLGANAAYAFVVWQHAESDLLAIHKLSDGKVKTYVQIHGAEDALWRVTDDRTAAYFAGTVIDIETGSFATLLHDIENPVALKSSFAGLTAEGQLIEFDSGEVRVFDEEPTTGLFGQFHDGRLVIETADGEGIEVVSELPVVIWG